MVRMALSALVQLIANALGLVVAASVLDDMSLHADGFVIAVLVFTGVQIVALPMVQKSALKGHSALSGSTAVVAAFVALLVTAIFSDGLEIDGLTTWVVATIIVWVAALLAALLLPVLVFKQLREQNQGR